MRQLIFGASQSPPSGIHLTSEPVAKKLACLGVELEPSLCYSSAVVLPTIASFKLQQGRGLDTRSNHE